MPSSKYTIHPANKSQAEGIFRLIQFFTYKNALLPKTKEEIERELDSFLVVPLPPVPEIRNIPPPGSLENTESMSAKASGSEPDPPPNIIPKADVPQKTRSEDDSIQFNPDLDVMGTVSLKKFNESLFEIRSLAVWPRFQGTGVGNLLLDGAVQKVRNGKLFTLTFVPDYFEKKGFTRVEKASLPEKIWEDCLRCRFIRDCNEVPLVLLRD